MLGGLIGLCLRVVLFGLADELLVCAFVGMLELVCGCLTGCVCVAGWDDLLFDLLGCGLSMLCWDRLLVYCRLWFLVLSCVFGLG